MSVKELAQKTRLSERSVQNATTDLKRSGELRVHPKAGEHARNGYRVIMTEPARRGADSAPMTPADSAPQAVRRGADIAPPQILHPADSAPHGPPEPQVNHVNPADSAPQPISDVLRSTSTGISEVAVKEASAKPARLDADRLCQHLADRIEANGSKRPTVTGRWRDAARLMLDRDGRTEEQIHVAIDWSQDHEFWRANILSMPKLREKYDQLRLQAMQKPGNRRQASTDALFDAAMQRAQAKEYPNDASRNGHARPLHRRLLPAAEDRQLHA